MTHTATEIYSFLFEYVKGKEIHASHTKTVKNKHIFILYGSVYDYSNPFEELSYFVEMYEPNNTTIEHGSTGAYIAFEFSDDKVKGEPEPQSSYDRIEPRNHQTNTVTECSNCCCRTNGLGRPPATLMYPSTPYEKPQIQEHDFCVTCSPAHFDDVTRVVEYFGVNENHDEILRVGYKNKDGSIEWRNMEDEDNPYVCNTVEAIEKYIL